MVNSLMPTDKSRITVNIETWMYDRITKIVEEEGGSRSSYLENLAREHLTEGFLSAIFDLQTLKKIQALAKEGYRQPSEQLKLIVDEWIEMHSDD